MLLTTSTAIHLRPRPSRLLAFYLSVAHLAALCMIALLSIGMVFQLLLGGLVLLSLIHYWRRDLLGFGRGVVHGAEWGTDGDWTLETGDGHHGGAVLCTRPFVHPLLVILNFKSVSGRRHRLVLPMDAVDSDVLRQLRVRLRLNHE